jgi:hypothetical protein
MEELPPAAIARRSNFGGGRHGFRRHRAEHPHRLRLDLPPPARRICSGVWSTGALGLDPCATGSGEPLLSSPFSAEGPSSSVRRQGALPSQLVFMRQDLPGAAAGRRRGFLPVADWFT